MAQATISCFCEAIHLEPALGGAPVARRNRRGFSAEKRIHPLPPRRAAAVVESPQLLPPPGDRPGGEGRRVLALRSPVSQANKIEHMFY